MNDATIVELVKNPARFTFTRKTRKSGTAGANTPTRYSNAVCRNFFFNGGDVDAVLQYVKDNGTIVKEDIPF